MYIPCGLFKFYIGKNLNNGAVIRILLCILIVIDSLICMEIAGVKIPDRIKVSGNELNLNGAGVLSRVFVDQYVCGLYLMDKTSDAQKVIEADETMEIKIIIVSDEVTSAKMKDNLLDGFRNSAGDDVLSILSEIDSFIKLFSEEIKVNDIFDMIYISGKGVQTFKNKKLFCTIPGIEFKKALFGIWLCEDPVKNSLKNDMLHIK